MKNVMQTAKLLQGIGLQIKAITQGSEEFDPSIELANGVEIQVARDGGYFVTCGECGYMAETKPDLLKILNELSK